MWNNMRKYLQAAAQGYQISSYPVAIIIISMFLY